MSKEIFVVPWNNVEQLQKVYKALYSHDITEMRWATEQISVWETRCQPSLPGGIEATAVLISAIIQDMLMSSGLSFCVEKDLETMYSMALIRFMNLIVEDKKSEGMRLSLKSVASLKEIPEWIVDLRNDASHRSTPSLPLLRIGAERAVKYLEKHFWKKEIECLKPYIKVEVNKEEEIEDNLRRFQAVRFQIYTRCPESKNLVPEMKSILKTLKGHLRHYKDQVIKVLIKDGIFLPFFEDCKAIMLEDEFCFFSDDAKESKFIPLSFEEFWFPLLKVIHEVNAIPDLLEALLLSQGERNELSQKMIMGWCNRILAAAITSGPRTSRLRKLFTRSGVLFDWKRLFFAATVNPSKYSAFNLPLVSSFLQLNRKFGQTVYSLYAIHQGFALIADTEMPLPGKRIFTLDNLKFTKTRQDAAVRKKEHSSDNDVWSLAPDDIVWKDVPIGTIHNPTRKVKEAPKVEEEPVEEEFVEKFILCSQDESEPENEEFDEEMPLEKPEISDEDLDAILKDRNGFMFGVNKEVSSPEQEEE